MTITQFIAPQNYEQEVADRYGRPLKRRHVCNHGSFEVLADIGGEYVVIDSATEEVLFRHARPATAAVWAREQHQKMEA